MADLRDRPFALIGVCVGGVGVTELRAVMDKEHLTWRSFCDIGNAGQGPIATRWNPPAIPTLYVLDAAGVIRNKWVGNPGEKAIDEALARLIGGR